jgi:carboxylesterase
MVTEIIKKVKSILFADPKQLFAEEKDLLNKAFSSKGTNGKGVLLIHGWTSTPYEVRRLGKYLNEKGFTVCGPLLRGHGTRPEDLENIKWQEWLADLVREVDELKKECQEVYVIGTSIGANLALFLAIEKPEIKKLVLLATPYKIKFEKILELWGKTSLPFKKYNNKYYPPTFGSRSTITRLISYQKYSVQSALETLELVRASRENLSRVTQPCLLIQSRQDHVVSYGSLEKIYAGLGSKIKKKKYINLAYHTFISDIKNEHIFEDIWDFLEND